MKPTVRHTSLKADQMRLVRGKLVKREMVDEDFTDRPQLPPTFRSNLLKFGKNVSEKLFSIDLGKISF